MALWQPVTSIRTCGVAGESGVCERSFNLIEAPLVSGKQMGRITRWAIYSVNPERLRAVVRDDGVERIAT
jgi:hypothetical protein